MGDGLAEGLAASVGVVSALVGIEQPARSSDKTQVNRAIFCMVIFLRSSADIKIVGDITHIGGRAISLELQHVGLPTQGFKGDAVLPA